MEEKKQNYVNERVIVRGELSGVFYGTLVSRTGREVEMRDCRRIWSWRGAASVSQLAVDGVKDKEGSCIAVSVASMEILDAVEVLQCSEEAIKNLDSVKEWKA